MREFDFNAMPIVDIVNEIIIDAVLKNASDIHFDPFENYLRIRIRIDGDLQDYSIIPNKYKRNLITRVKLLSGMNITESRLPQDGAIKSTIQGKDLDLRVSALPTSFGEKVVIRILDYSMSLKGIEALGFTEDNYQLILKMLQNPNGIILITGATGSGKSTTVYSMLQKLNREETNIITVEDPVEMNIEGINQIQINPEIGLDFASVLRSILRQDPNIILIGEIRDSETAKIAIRASITGHLVLSTLHTNNSLTTIERLLDMDVERYLLSASLKGIISQNLAKRLCKNCAQKRPTTEMEKRIFKKALHTDIEEVYEPVGCPKCHGGYKGRIALQEVLLIDDEVRNAINDNLRRQDLKKLIYKKGVKTLLQDGLLKVIEGITTMEEVFRLVDVSDDSDDIYSNNNEEITTHEIAQPHILEKENQENTQTATKNTTQRIILEPKKQETFQQPEIAHPNEIKNTTQRTSEDIFNAILKANNLAQKKETNISFQEQKPIETNHQPEKPTMTIENIQTEIPVLKSIPKQPQKEIKPNEEIPQPKRYIDSDEEVFFKEEPKEHTIKKRFIEDPIEPKQTQNNPNDHISNYTEDLIRLINKDLLQ